MRSGRVPKALSCPRNRGNSRLPWRAGAFLLALEGNREAANAIALEASPVAAAISHLMTDRKEWVGTATELLEALEAREEEKVRRLQPWPKSPRSLADHVRRLAPNLRVTGIGVEFVKTGGKGSRRLIILTRKDPDPSDACDASDATGAAGDEGDAGVADSRASSIDDALRDLF